MITTNNREIYKKAVMLRDHGKPDHEYNIHTEFGYNWRMSEFHAALGQLQLDKANWIIRERRRLAALYDSLLGAQFQTVKLPLNIKSAYYKYPVFLPDGFGCARDAIKRILKDKYRIELTGEVYERPLHSQPVFENHPWAVSQNEEPFEDADWVCSRHICLPLYPGLKDDEVEYVCDSLKECVKEWK